MRRKHKMNNSENDFIIISKDESIEPIVKKMKNSYPSENKRKDFMSLSNKDKHNNENKSLFSSNPKKRKKNKFVENKKNKLLISDLNRKNDNSVKLATTNSKTKEKSKVFNNDKLKLIKSNNAFSKSIKKQQNKKDNIFGKNNLKSIKNENKFLDLNVKHFNKAKKYDLSLTANKSNPNFLKSKQKRKEYFKLKKLTKLKQKSVPSNKKIEKLDLKENSSNLTNSKQSEMVKYGSTQHKLKNKNEINASHKANKHIKDISKIKKKKILFKEKLNISNKNEELSFENYSSTNTPNQLDNTNETPVLNDLPKDEKSNVKNNSDANVSKMKNKKDTKEKLSRTLFVGNLPLDISKKALKQLFSKYGKIESVRQRCVVPLKSNMPKKLASLKKSYHPNAHSVNGYVVFKEANDAKKALSLNGTIYSGHHLRVDNTNGTNVFNKKRSVFLGNLPFNIEEESIWSKFAECGDIEGVRLIKDNVSGVGKGFGYVLFKDENHVKSALDLNGQNLFGRSIRVHPVKNEFKKEPKFTPFRKRKMLKSRAFQPPSKTLDSKNKKTLKKIRMKKKLTHHKKEIASLLNKTK